MEEEWVKVWAKEPVKSEVEQKRLREERESWTKQQICLG